MFGSKVSQKTLVSFGILAILLVPVSLSVHSILSKNTVTVVSNRVEKATCHIGSVVLGSTNLSGATTFYLNLNNACKVAGKWVAMTTQYHYSKGYTGIEETIPNISLINDSLIIPNLGNNGYEQKIVKILFFPNTKQVASEKDITYWLK